MQRLTELPLVAAGRQLQEHAVIGGARHWTWGEVHAASIALAARLDAGATVCNLCGSRVGFFVAWLAALRRTGMLSPLRPAGARGACVLLELARPATSSPMALVASAWVSSR